ncbi:hypothetical protein BV898_02159 [Hypsibius exemplaris]|uniref:Uncharacterized protein n=1 Tax=Hypsibius exemplaris TaxID=2072580 RepID=A0A1W0XAB3_HYPEX|nr:hypothetical protein BV898_02159 [Hypsibius exemplaris]
MTASLYMQVIPNAPALQDALHRPAKSSTDPNRSWWQFLRHLAYDCTVPKAQPVTSRPALRNERVAEDGDLLQCWLRSPLRSDQRFDARSSVIKDAEIIVHRFLRASRVSERFLMVIAQGQAAAAYFTS